MSKKPASKAGTDRQVEICAKRTRSGSSSESDESNDSNSESDDSYNKKRKLTTAAPTITIALAKAKKVQEVASSNTAPKATRRGKEAMAAARAAGTQPEIKRKSKSISPSNRTMMTLAELQSPVLVPVQLKEPEQIDTGDSDFSAASINKKKAKATPIVKKKKPEDTRYALQIDRVTIIPSGAAWSDDEVKALIRVSKKMEGKAADGKMSGPEKWNNAFPYYMNKDFGSVRLNETKGVKVTSNPYYQKWGAFRRMINDYNSFVSIDGDEIERANSGVPTGGGVEDGVEDERTSAYEESLAAKEARKEVWFEKNVSRHHVELIDYFNEMYPNSVAGEGIVTEKGMGRGLRKPHKAKEDDDEETEDTVKKSKSEKVFKLIGSLQESMEKSRKEKSKHADNRHYEQMAFLKQTQSDNLATQDKMIKAAAHLQSTTGKNNTLGIGQQRPQHSPRHGVHQHQFALLAPAYAFVPAWRLQRIQHGRSCRAVLGLRRFALHYLDNRTQAGHLGRLPIGHMAFFQYPRADFKGAA